MSLLLGQIVYTSFPNHGFRALVSARIPAEVPDAFVELVAHRYWNAYDPPKPGYCAVYLHQLSSEKNLFGWLFNDGTDDMERSNVPYFLCYYLAGALQTPQLEAIFKCLAHGPIAIIDPQQLPTPPGNLLLPDECNYQAARQGVHFPDDLRHRGHRLLSDGKLLDLFFALRTRNLRTATGALTLSPSSPTIPMPEISPDSLQSEWLPRAKVALLVGVSSYGPGFEALPGAEEDVEALRQVLEHPKIGQFGKVQTLLNPNRQEMAEAIESLFMGCQKNDQVLFYFSGHALVSPQGQVSLTTGISRRDRHRKVVRSTLIPSDFLYEVIRDCPSQQQVIILDCGLENAVLGDEGTDAVIQSQWQLSGQGRTILMSTTSTQPFLKQKGTPLSAYTFYLVEGLRTGIADLNGDGLISVQEWHQYARRKTQIATPAVNPKAYRSREGQTILVAHASTTEPTLCYRRVVERYGQRGVISPLHRVVLDRLQTHLKLTTETAQEITLAVHKPYRDYQAKLQEYALAFVDMAAQEYPIREVTYQHLKGFQGVLGLTDGDTAPLETELLQHLSLVQTSESIASPLGLLVPAATREGTLVEQLLQPALAAKRYALPALNGGIARYLSQRWPIAAFPGGWQAAAQLLRRRTTWLVIGAVMLTGVAITSVINWQRQQQESRTLETITQLAKLREYEVCASQAQTVDRRSSRYAEAQTLWRQCQAGAQWQKTTVQALQGQTGAIWALTLSSDGRTIASGGNDQQVYVWDLSGQQLLDTFEGHRDRIWSLDISPVGSVLASGSGDTTIKLWNLASGQLIRTFTHHTGTVWALAFSPDGQVLVSGSEDGTIAVWNLNTARLGRTLTGHTDAVRAIAIAPDSTTLVSGSSDRTLKIWNLKTGQLLRTLTGHRDRITTISISANGEILASGSLDQTLKIWDLKQGKLLQTLNNSPKGVIALALNPSGDILASNSGGFIKIWNTNTGKLLHTLTKHTKGVTALVFSNDGRTLLSASQDATIQVWQR
jgi:WD40 repeat protein